MPEFSSFNGYTVKDTTARNIAKGRNQAVAFGDYASMIVALNAMEKGEYKTGQNIYIGTVGVPDLWVYSTEDILHVFVHESDEDVVEKLTANTTIQVGYYKLAMLEGQKVDLTTYDNAIAEANKKITENAANISGKLTNPDGENFYFDIQNGVRGYNTDAARGADTFHPFKQGIELVGSVAAESTSYTSDESFSLDCSGVNGFELLTVDSFLFVPTSNRMAANGDSGGGSFNGTYSLAPSNLAYDAKNGLLTGTYSRQSRDQSSSGRKGGQKVMAYDVYLI